MPAMNDYTKIGTEFDVDYTFIPPIPSSNKFLLSYYLLLIGTYYIDNNILI